MPPALELPLWPPILATRGAGARSALHAHHAMHLVVAIDGELKVRWGAKARWGRGAGVLTSPDVLHAIDARGVEVLLVFFDPESDAGEALRLVLREPVRVLSTSERAEIARDARPEAMMSSAGMDWARHLVEMLGGTPVAARRSVHPRVRKLLAMLRTLPSQADTSLDTLARAVGLSPSRLMHAFTESIGVPLRPYLAWLKLERAAAAIVTGAPLVEAAYGAGFADAAHMSRTFRRMFGIPPSALRPPP